jgi:hypothetical protein
VLSLLPKVVLLLILLIQRAYGSSLMPSLCAKASV